jgi:photosynthetic reaction center cytochrome c subunit
MNRIIFIAVIIFVIGMTMALRPPRKASPPADAGPNNYTNLKVLPKNISPKQLQQIMVDEFEDGLGVGCGFCHAEAAGSHRLDYANDSKPEKNIARMMMRMTLKINKQYFGQRRPMLGGQGIVITCVTCHKGSPRPGED